MEVRHGVAPTLPSSLRGGVLAGTRAGADLAVIVADIGPARQ